MPSLKLWQAILPLIALSSFWGSISRFEIFYRTCLPNKTPEEPDLVIILIFS